MATGGVASASSAGVRTDVRPRAVGDGSSVSLDEASAAMRALESGGSGRAAGCRTDIRPTAPRKSAGGCESEERAAASTACMSAAAEAHRVHAMADDELHRRLSLARAEKALQLAAARETATATAHQHVIEGYEAELRRAAARRSSAS